MSEIHNFIIFDLSRAEDVGVVRAQTLNQIYEALQSVTGAPWPEVYRVYSVYRECRHAD